MRYRLFLVCVLSMALLAYVLMACSKSENSDDDIISPTQRQEIISNAETMEDIGTTTDQSIDIQPPETEYAAEIVGPEDEDVEETQITEWESVEDHIIPEPITIADESDTENGAQITGDGDIVLPAVP